jgi:hypothetical protein
MHYKQTKINCLHPQIRFLSYSCWYYMNIQYVLFTFHAFRFSKSMETWRLDRYCGVWHDCFYISDSETLCLVYLPPWSDSCFCHVDWKSCHAGHRYPTKSMWMILGMANTGSNRRNHHMISSKHPDRSLFDNLHILILPYGNIYKKQSRYFGSWRTPQDALGPISFKFVTWFHPVTFRILRFVSQVA